jgi:multicomponent Na+:H+ antiporter subunit G
MMLDALTAVLVVAGGFLFMAGTVGLLRFPDRLSRLHALTKVDNLGLGLIVAGLVPQGGVLLALKLICAWLLVQFSGAIVTQMIGNAARHGEKP